MPEETKQSVDHDLLIELRTRFQSFENMTANSWKDMNEKMTIFLSKLDDKADRRDVNDLDKAVEKLDERVRKVEDFEMKQQTRKTFAQEIREMGFKGWTVLIGVISIFIALINSLKG